MTCTAGQRRLRSAAARDLAWMLLTPDYLAPTAPRWSGRLATLTAAERDEGWRIVQALDARPAHQWLGELPASLPLGRYCERLLERWLERSRLIDLLASHRQLSDGARTIGELDALVRRHDLPPESREQHWEIAVAYFLRIGPGLHGWVGPDMSDTLSGKVVRIFGHQLRLGMHPSFRAQWGQRFAPAAFTRGWCFLPLDRVDRGSDRGIEHGVDREPAVPNPDDDDTVNPLAPRGWWCDDTPASLERLEASQAVDHWLALPRRQWLAPRQLDRIEMPPCTSVSRVVASARVAGEDGALLLAGMRAEGAGWFECTRGFVVPSGPVARARERVRTGRHRARWPGLRL